MQLVMIGLGLVSVLHVTRTIDESSLSAATVKRSYITELRGCLNNVSEPDGTPGSHQRQCPVKWDKTCAMRQDVGDTA